MKRKTLARILMVLAGVFVTLATLLTSIDIAAFDKRFYRGSEKYEGGVMDGEIKRI